MGYLMYEGSGEAGRAFGGAGLCPHCLQPVLPAELVVAPRQSHKPSARGTSARWQRAALPWLLLRAGRCQQGAQEPARGATLQAAESALGNALHGAGVRGECPRRGADNNKERIWVRALAGLCWGCRERWLVWQLQKQLLLDIFHLQRVGRRWAANPGSHSPAQLLCENWGGWLRGCLASP